MIPSIVHGRTFIINDPYISRSHPPAIASPEYFDQTGIPGSNRSAVSRRFSCIHAIVLLLPGSDSLQHGRMCHATFTMAPPDTRWSQIHAVDSVASMPAIHGCDSCGIHSPGA